MSFKIIREILFCSGQMKLGSSLRVWISMFSQNLEAITRLGQNFAAVKHMGVVPGKYILAASLALMVPWVLLVVCWPSGALRRPSCECWRMEEDHFGLLW